MININSLAPGTAIYEYPDGTLKTVKLYDGGMFIIDFVSDDTRAEVKSLLDKLQEVNNEQKTTE